MGMRISAATRLAGLAVMGVLATTGGAMAVEDSEEQRAALKACEKKICTMIVGKAPAGEDLSCALSKSWASKQIKDGIEKQKLSWSLGDARCSVSIAAKRADVVEAVSKPDHSFQFEPHTVKCEVEREKEVTPINITLAPKLQFKGGKAEKAWLNVSTIEAPAVVKGAIWTAAQLEQNFGLFHGLMIAEINEFIGQKCPKAVAGN